MTGRSFSLLASVNTRRQRVLMVGGGSVGTRKIATLLGAGCEVILVSPEATPELRELATAGRIRWLRRTVLPEDFAAVRLVLLALPLETKADGASTSLEQALAWARKAGCLVNCAACADEGDWALVAQFRHGPCFIGIGTGGDDPCEAVRLKRHLLACLDTEETRKEGMSRSESETPGGDSPAEETTHSDGSQGRGAASRGEKGIFATPRSEHSGNPGRHSGNDAQPLVLLSRGSPLALRQAELAAAALATRGARTEVRTVTSHGDRDQKTPLSAFGGFGAFVKALEEGLLAGEGDGAVHSLKDVPSKLGGDERRGTRLVLAGVLPRESARDLLLTLDGLPLEALPPGAKVGTSSLRRRAQLLFLRPDLEVVPFRGNVETRLRKLREGQVAATILAEAGLSRLDNSPDGRGGSMLSEPDRELLRRGSAPLPFLAAPGQGAVAVETCAGTPLEQLLRDLDHLPTRLAVTAERAFLTEFACGCVLPLGVHGLWESGVLHLRAELLDGGGKARETAELETEVASLAEAEEAGKRLWKNMAENPLARRLVAAAKRTPSADVP
ncbi:hydroxymethylbilane synthase [Aminiphilus sp.]|uniref:hydroxymethylbilane synthase n=1 Tax=Aminiphilus sp. TaxID=1872488 RepID=UPI002604F734|nr:hydroxymethylbilane synthase [Aminiphilus sp.]